MTNHEEEKLVDDVNELLELVRLLTEELGVEFDLHYTEDELPLLGDTNTVQLLVKSAKILRRHGIQPPSVVGTLLLAVATSAGSA